MADGGVRAGRLPIPQCVSRGTRIAAAALLAAACAGPPGAAEAGTQAWPTFGFPDFAAPAFEDDTPAPPRARRALRRRAAKPAVKAAGKPKGPLLIAVSLQRQSLKVFDADGLFAEAPVSTGKRGHATPTGIFSVIQKNKWHRSNLYSGAPMPYMQRLTWSGIALHAGALPGYPASHGCIRMPNAFSAQLWSWTRRGARVVVSHGEVAPVAITHPLLEALAAADPVVAAPAPAGPDGLGLRPSLSVAPESLRTADAGPLARPDGPIASDAPPPLAMPVDAAPAADAAPPPVPAKRGGPISVLVSRKDGRLYARQDFAPLFDMPITIEEADRPLGTHVFTARRDPADRKRFLWTALTLPGAAPGAASETAAVALDRLNLPQEAMARIAEGLASGSSLIVADPGLKSGETGRGTEFVVLTR